MSKAQGIEVRVSFKDSLHNTYVTVGTDDAEKAKEIARLWGQSQKSKVTRVLVKEPVIFDLAGHGCNAGKERKVPHRFPQPTLLELVM